MLWVTCDKDVQCETSSMTHLDKSVRLAMHAASPTFPSKLNIASCFKLMKQCVRNQGQQDVLHFEALSVKPR